MSRPEIDALKIARDALDTDHGARGRFVAQQCSGNKELQARVESMLDRIGHDDVHSDGFAGDKFGDEGADHTHLHGMDDTLLGDQLGPYRVVERVGRGGMGIVYRGIREGADFAQEVAIKLIRRGYDFDDVHARFVRERRILARLTHPNLARFIDGGVTDNGRPWFALEFVRGEPITSWCDRNRLTVRSRLQLFIEVCSAVQYAHTCLVVHRDLKPGNVLVDESGAVRLLDFGVAGLIAGDGDDQDLSSTISVGYAMTPEYAAPEQFAGASVGVSADVYSLGVLAYELIAGVLPYAIDRHDQVSTAHIVATTPPQQLSAAIARASNEPTESATDQRIAARRTNLRAFRRAVRGDLGRIIEKALAKEPERRYPTVQAFADDLSRWLAGAPVHVIGNRVGYRTAKFVRRNRVAVSLGGLAFALLIAGVVGVVWKSQEALREAERANAVKAFVLSLFDSNVPGAAIDTVPNTRDLLARGVERVQAELKDQPLLRADMLTTLGRIHNQLSLYDEADPLLRQAIVLEESESGSKPLDRAVTLRELAQSLTERQRYAEASELLEQALQLVKGNHDATEAAVRQLLGLALTGDKHPERGLRENLAAIALWREIEKPPGVKVASALAEYGATLLNANKVEESLVPNREALDMLRKIHGGVHADIAVVASNIGVALITLGRVEESLVHLSEAVEVDRRVYGSKHRALAVHLSNFGAAQLAVGHMDEAEDAFRESVAVRSALYGENSAETAKSKNNLAATLARMEKFAEVEQVLRSSIAALKTAEGDWRHWISISENNLASALVNLNRPDEARGEIDRAIALRAELDPDKNSKAALDQESIIGDIEVRKGQLDRAEARLQELVDRSLANMPANAPGLPDRYGQLADVKFRQGKFAEAKTNFEEAIRLETKRAGTISPTMIRARLGLAETFINLHDKSAASDQLALVSPAVNTLRAGHSQRRRAAELEASLSSQEN